MSVVPLVEAGPDCGNKASGLAILLRAGLPVPDGFVVTDPDTDPGLVAASLDRLSGTAFAVRSSGWAEDSVTASFAGQLETVLGVRTLADVLAAVRRCAASGSSPRALAYRNQRNQADAETKAGAGAAAGSEASVPVIVQELVAADCAGVLFTRDPRTGDESFVVNASWGLGESVVAGAVVPDEIVVGPSPGSLRISIGTKSTRLDLEERGPEERGSEERGLGEHGLGEHGLGEHGLGEHGLGEHGLGGHGLVRSPVAAVDQARECLGHDDIERLVALGRRCEALFGRPQDIEWAVCQGQPWVLQSRPITAIRAGAGAGTGAGTGTGAGAGEGRVTGPVRIVRGVDDFPKVRRGDVLVCRTTDPAWTPLFGLVAAVVTEQGGILSHAAIVAREFGIPAVVGVERAMSRLIDGAQVTVDGHLGTVA